MSFVRSLVPTPPAPLDSLPLPPIFPKADGPCIREKTIEENHPTLPQKNKNDPTQAPSLVTQSLASSPLFARWGFRVAAASTAGSAAWISSHQHLPHRPRPIHSDAR